MATFVVILTVLVVFYLLYKWMKLSPCSSQNIKDFVSRCRQGQVAHRAGSPENTLAGIRLAKRNGASAVEVDLAFTKDGVPVLLHDATVDRTSNGMGKLSDLTFKQVRQLDFGCKYGPEFTGEVIPRMEDALSLCEELDLLVYLEVKTETYKAIEAITACLAHSPSLYQYVAVISFFPGVLYKLRKAVPNVKCGMTLVGKALALHPDGKLEGKATWKLVLAPYCDVLVRWCLKTWLQSFLGIKMLLPQKDLVLKGEMDPPAYWATRGVSMVTWTVNNKEEKMFVDQELKIPYLTDCLDPNSTVPEQFNHIKQN